MPVKAFDYRAAFYGHEHEPDKFIAAVDSLLASEKTTIRAIPYPLWAHRRPGSMAVWIRST